jgi:hypothetical protein
MCPIDGVQVVPSVFPLIDGRRPIVGMHVAGRGYRKRRARRRAVAAGTGRHDT